MSNYDNTNRGVLFLQRQKESERHPDYTGEINVEGVKFRLAAWKQVSKDGNVAYLSISMSDHNPSFKPQEQSSDGESAENKAVADQLRNKRFEEEPINLDDIPF